MSNFIEDTFKEVLTFGKEVGFAAAEKATGVTRSNDAALNRAVGGEGPLDQPAAARDAASGPPQTRGLTGLANEQLRVGSTTIPVWIVVLGIGGLLWFSKRMTS